MAAIFNWGKRWAFRLQPLSWWAPCRADPLQTAGYLEGWKAPNNNTVTLATVLEVRAVAAPRSSRGSLPVKGKREAAHAAQQLHIP